VTTLWWHVSWPVSCVQFQSLWQRHWHSHYGVIHCVYCVACAFALYCGLTVQDLLRIVLDQHSQLLARDAYARDLEDYLDNLLVKVMETHPKILQNPYVRPPNACNNNSAVSGNSAAVRSLPASAGLPPGVYVTNQLNKSSTNADVTQSVSSKVKSKKAKGKRIELLRVFSRRS